MSVAKARKALLEATHKLIDAQYDYADAMAREAALWAATRATILEDTRICVYCGEEGKHTKECSVTSLCAAIERGDFLKEAH
jgi:hypothetical protein